MSAAKLYNFQKASKQSIKIVEDSLALQHDFYKYAELRIAELVF